MYVFSMIITVRIKLLGAESRFTGLHVHKTYTSLGTSCLNAHTKFLC